MASIRTPSEASFDLHTDYFADFDGAHCTPENESSNDRFEDESLDAPSENNNPEEVSQHMSHHPGVTGDEQEDRAGHKTGHHRRGLRRIRRWLKRIANVVLVCTIGLMFHPQGY
ncbi:uncharacterized protein SETTUDRAFT_30742 [Exserohilum turcica Et28A]|uniref:Uncharacterized protein n=1 Tax=Exserohilum turcicum (strain 28A) TaxID=671987 RepID=R0J5U4_EXST2|nr:uncharacterized protein SETTUDRAFT_30742 [Exserohilum turcica Et28A]EOA92280.1 hypothetical protein SETTUDRAFT_30742 [Exserohilum turcica Et28A]